MTASTTILLVGEHQISRRPLHGMLRSAGWRVVEASTGRAALAMAMTTWPDLVVQDLVLSDMDGFELLRHLRGLRGGNRLPVLGLAGFLNQVEDTPGDARELTAWLVKPVEPTRLADAVRALLERPAEPPARDSADRFVEPQNRADANAAAPPDDLMRQRFERQLAELSTITVPNGVLSDTLTRQRAVVDALTRGAGSEASLQNLLAATLDAAGVTKGALMIRDAAGIWALRHDVGLSKSEHWALREFFGTGTMVDAILLDGVSVLLPSPGMTGCTSADLMANAHVTSAQFVPLFYEGRAFGIMFLGATRADLTTPKAIAFGQALAARVAGSLSLIEAVSLASPL